MENFTLRTSLRKLKRSVFVSGPPSFSNPPPNAPPVGSNNLGLIPTAPHPQQPNRPMMSPTNSSGPPTSNSDFQTPSYNGTELVMLYDYKVGSAEHWFIGKWCSAQDHYYFHTLLGSSTRWPYRKKRWLGVRRFEQPNGRRMVSLNGNILSIALFFNIIATIFI